MTDYIKKLVNEYNADYEENEKIKEEQEKKRRSFVEDFPIDKISSLEIEDFVVKEMNGELAKNRGPHGKGTFIYRMEQEKREQTEKEKNEGKDAKPWLMDISGTPTGPIKWGCYRYEDKDKFNETIKKIKYILEKRNHNDLDGLIDSKPLRKQAICKILATYYPSEFLPNSSDEYAKIFLNKVGINSDETNVLKLNKKIMNWRDNNAETKHWDNIDLTRFMYGEKYMNAKEKKDIDKNNKKSVEGEKGEETYMINNIIDMKRNKNIILYGPPGTGKTYNTIPLALSICKGTSFEEEYKKYCDNKNRESVIKEFNNLKNEERIGFVTFHQAYGYEDFIEGIKPKFDNEEQLLYEPKDGIFKEFCEKTIKKDDSNEQVFDNAWDNMIEKSETNNNKVIIEFGKRNNKFELLVEEDTLYHQYGGIGTGEHSFSRRQIKKYWMSQKKKDDNYSLKKQGIIDYLYKECELKDYKPPKEIKNKVFIIDEINRGNISKIFGELITLIEENKRQGAENEMSVTLPLSGDEFIIPNNVYIIGTMNTADRSIALLDTALRRRFKFIEMMPDYDVLNDMKIDGINIREIAEKINKRIEALLDREHTIGHAYYLKLKNNLSIDGLAELFRYQIVPLLQEYFYDDYEKIRFVLGDNGKEEKKYQFVQKEEIDQSIFKQGDNTDDNLDTDNLKPNYNINEEAFKLKESYLGII